jgi:tetratricopeptide (TPR) repeat protein
MMLLQLEANARSCWKLIPDVLGTFSHDLLHYVQEQLAAVTTVLESSPPPDIRVRLASIAGELAQIIGEILFDLKENYQAEQYYNVAIEAAKIAQNDVMQAVALGRKCFIPIYNHDAGRGLPYIERARALTKENAPNLTRAWLAAVEAEILANMAEEKRCRKALDNCESALKHAQPGESSYARFSYPTLLGYKGICYIRLKQLHVAEKVLCEALTIIEPDRIRHKSIILVDLARTYMQQGEIEEACQYASQALVIILQVKSARVFQRVLNFRHMLQPWQRTMVVKHLDEEIASVYPFVAHTRA